MAHWHQHQSWRVWTVRAALALLVVGGLGGCAANAPGAQTGTATPTSTQVIQSGATQTPSASTTQTPAATTTPAIVGVPNCQPNQLTLTMLTVGAAAGHLGQMGKFTNASKTTCTLYGFPGAQMLDAQHNPLPTKALWQTSAYMYSNQQKQLVKLAPGAAAYFAVTWSDVTVGSETSCPTSAYLSVTPPNDFSVLTVADQITACGGGSLEISPVEPKPMMGQ